MEKQRKILWRHVFVFVFFDIILGQQSQIKFNIPSSNLSFSENIPYSPNPSFATQISQIRVDATNSQNLIQVTCRSDLSSPDACSTFNLFALNQNQNSWVGNLYLVKKLNYLDNPFYIVFLSATNTASSATQQLIISVMMGYDRPPYFTSGLNVQIVERPTISNQDAIIQYQARARDPNVDYSINYRITEGPYASYFFLDQITGRLTNVKPLTYSDPIWNNGFVTIVIEAALVINRIPQWGNVNASTKADSTITLLDQNNYTPTFNMPSYTGLVSERAIPNTLVDKLFISVFDQDYTPINSRFSLYLSQYTDIFDVSPAVGTKNIDSRIVVKNSSSFDFDYGQRIYSFNIIAVETNSTALRSSTAAVTVNLTQVNKYPPVFVPTNFYTVSIPENQPKSTQILKIQAIDRDVGYIYGNQSIRYKFISGGTSLILLDAVTGVISTSTCPKPGVSPCIDYERPENRYFPLVVAAVDQMGEGFSATATIFINVTNINDNSPIFSSNIYNGEITDGKNYLNTPLPNIQATDADGDTIIYSIFSGNTPNNVWYIDPSTAVLSVNRNITYNDALPNNGYFLLTINASDGIPSHNAQCIANITVKPENRYAPQFDNSYYMTSISETTPPGAYVYTMLARDADNPLTPGGRLLYRIEQGGQDKFDINPVTGIVSVRSGTTFNYIITPQYNITIVASDQGFPSLSNRTLLIVNITPYKAGPDFGTNVILGPPQKKTNEVGQYVMTITVSDRDPNPRFIYSFVEPIMGFDKNGVPVATLSNPDKMMFVIDPSTGAIKIGSPLDYERIAKWQAVIKCLDDNSPNKLFSTTTFMINILPVNEQAPVFTLPWNTTNPFYSVTLPQSMNQLQSPIGTFQAVSPNKSLQITYSLINNPQAYFRLNSSNSYGYIYLNQPLNFNMNQNPQVTLVATDNGDPSLNSSATITFILKKEKSTDCDSALIPLLCVHG